jgi:hypothetical protein
MIESEKCDSYPCPMFLPPGGVWTGLEKVQPAYTPLCGRTEFESAFEAKRQSKRVERSTLPQVGSTAGNAKKLQKDKLHRTGIEPVPEAWEASILPLNYRCRINTCQSRIIYYIILTVSEPPALP